MKNMGEMIKLWQKLNRRLHSVRSIELDRAVFVCFCLLSLIMNVPLFTLIRRINKTQRGAVVVVVVVLLCGWLQQQQQQQQ